jgi:DNA-directed RNA polymerase subunit RPC12/RpoP
MTTRESEKMDAPSNENLVARCSGCSAPVSASDVTCPRCGRKLEALTKLIPCPDCGHQISRTAVACPGCGRRIAFAMPIFSAIFWAAVVLTIFGAIVVALLQIINMRP